MRAARLSLCGVAAALATVSAAAAAEKLKVVNVGAPKINCVFHSDCKVRVDDSSDDVLISPLSSPGGAWLQSRTFIGAPGTPAAGATAYEYRLDMTQATGSLECIAGLVVDFGPPVRLPYSSNDPADEIFVITGGGVGSIGISSAEHDGDVITFHFSKLLCPTAQPNSANTTFFFGLASTKPPVKITAGMFGTGTISPYYRVGARGPQH